MTKRHDDPRSSGRGRERPPFAPILSEVMMFVGGTVSAGLCLGGKFGEAAPVLLVTVVGVWITKYVTGTSSSDEGKKDPRQPGAGSSGRLHPVQIGYRVRRIRQGTFLFLVVAAALVACGIWLARKDNGTYGGHHLGHLGVFLALACASSAAMLVSTVGRAALSSLSHQLRECPSLCRWVVVEGSATLAGLVEVDLLFIPYPRGALRVFALGIAFALSLGSLGSYMYVAWKRADILAYFHVPSLQERTFDYIHEKAHLWRRPIVTVAVKVALSAIAAVVCVLPLVGSGMATALSVTAVVTRPALQGAPILHIGLPELAPVPPPESLGSYGYAEICGGNLNQQPGYGTTGSIQQGFQRIWSGPGIGVGGSFAGCWGPAEVVKSEDGISVSYDVGSVSGQIKSLVIATSTGEAEIFLVDGHREAYAAALLMSHELITGTQRYDIFNGDFQLIYTPNGTITTIRQVKHPTGEAQVSQRAMELTEPETVAWLQAMRSERTWLWPISFPAGYGCASEVSLVTESGDPVASICPGKHQTSATLTIATPNDSGTTAAIPISSDGSHTSWQDILGIAGQPIRQQ